MTTDSNKLVTPVAKPKPPAAGMGRKKGSVNKTTKAIKDMILEALANKGGVTYLQQQAEDNPVAFMGLLGKIMPTQITGEDGDAIRLTTVIERRVVKAGN